MLFLFEAGMHNPPVGYSSAVMKNNSLRKIREAGGRKKSWSKVGNIVSYLLREAFIKEKARILPKTKSRFFSKDNLSVLFEQDTSSPKSI